ncbi:MAG: DUF192 domain-containing protein [Candidatus Aenigmarchaeota archaeon]|nr:DUF192 domain-containing protein [Candidatus Aenigmarchaeota archaeon]
MRRLLILLMIVIVFLMIAIPLDLFELSHYYDVSMVCFGKDCFEVELAVTPAEKNMGLMERESLELDSGMLFIFDTMGKRSFWMKDVRIGLDMIFIDDNSVVVYIEKDAMPCTGDCPFITPDRDYMYVLEINGGLSEELGIRVGDIAIMRAAG